MQLNRNHRIGLTTLCGIIVIGASMPNAAESQLGYIAGIRLQATTPGTVDTGHGNISGTMIAGQFVGGGTGVTGVNAAQLGGNLASAFGLLGGANTWTGANTFGNAGNSFTGSGAGLTALNASNLTSGTLASGRLIGTYSNPLIFSNGSNSFTGNGAGLTGVNADLLDGLNSTAFLQSIPMPLALSGTQAGTFVIRGLNGSPTTDSSGVFGLGAATSGNTVGVWGSVLSPTGTGVKGTATATTGLNYGVWGETSSTQGTAVYGRATAANGVGIQGDAMFSTGNGVGVLGKASSSTGIGVQGIATNGAGIGGYFTAQNATNAFAVFAVGRTGVYGGSVGLGYGIFGESISGLSGVYGKASGTTLSGVLGENSLTTGYGVYGKATSTTGNNSGGYFETLSAGGNGVTGIALSATGDTNGGYFETHSTGGQAVNGLSTAFTGTNFGGRFESASTGGRGVYGLASHTLGSGYGGIFRSFGTSGTGVYGHADSTSGINYGGYFKSESQDGYGVYALRDQPNGGGAAGYFRSTGLGYSLMAMNDGNGAAAIFESTGYITFDVRNTGTSGPTNAIWATIDSPGGQTIIAQANATTGTSVAVTATTDSPNGRGVEGICWSNNAGATPYGVYGNVNSLTNGFAVFASGNSATTGTKSFRIDHPFDPLNKYLLHYCTESPYPQNTYNGNIRTDSRGYAWVELPDYFEEINTNFKYQLTIVDEADSEDFILAKVVRKVQNNRFQIRTNKPNVEVSWEVKADRNDLYVQRKKPTDVREKYGPEKGTYQMPELYGAGPEMGMDFARRNRLKNGARNGRK